jgi:hypothetical protein
MHQLLVLLVMLASVAAPLVPLDCPLITDAHAGEPVVAHGVEGHHAGHGRSHEGHHDTGSAGASESGVPGHSGAHHGDTGCRAGSMCGGVGLLSAPTLGSGQLLASHPAVSTPPGGWPTPWPGHDTPPPRLLV